MTSLLQKRRKKDLEQFRDHAIAYAQQQIKILSAQISDLEWDGADENIVSPLREKRKAFQNNVSEMLESCQPYASK